MLGNAQEILDAIRPEDRVLDVGGGVQPLARADVVLDITPYEKRGTAGGLIGEAPERFTRDSWVVMDFSSHERFPFPDKSFDFVFCSHTLEDIADPFWLCAEINRVGKRGYIETPSRAAESAIDIAGSWRLNKNYFAGYYHHRWFVEDKDGSLVFTAKYPLIHAFKEYQIPKRYVTGETKYLPFWWEDNFPFREEQVLSAETALHDLRDFRLRFEHDPESRAHLASKLDRLSEKLQQPGTVDFWKGRLTRVLHRLTVWK